MKTSIQFLHIGNAKLYFFFDQDHQPAIDVEGAIYTSLFDLLNDFPQLADSQQADKLAQVTNFLVKGLEFHFIEDIRQFQEDYAQLLEAGQFELLQNTPCLNDYGTYDVSIMHPPRLDNKELVFFVQHDYTKIPYRASLTYPITEDFKVHYELLPSL